MKVVVAETGALKGKSRRALDSTILDDAVATQDTVTQLIAAIRRVRREVPGAGGVVGEHCTAHDYDDPGKPKDRLERRAGPAASSSTRWSATRTGCWVICPSRNWTPRPRRQSRCWR